MANTPTGRRAQDSHQPDSVEPSRNVTDKELLERFIALRDQAAFAGLVERYGRCVWGVCRRVLSQEQDVEDAFQAVFFILARKAGSIRKQEAVGSWLYGVAYRTARKARQSAARRQDREKQATTVRAEQPPWGEAACQELQRLLDEEVQRLAEKYRAPFVLCCLEGLSKTEAAQELGWKAGTVSGRLAQARKLLQTRLARRGVTLSAVLTTIALTQKTAAAAAPPILLQATVQGVLAPQADKAEASKLSPAVLALAQGVLNSMARVRITLGLALLLVLPLLAAGAGLAAYHLGTSPSPRQGLMVEATAVRIATQPGGQQPGPPPVDKEVVSLAFSPDGKRLVTVGARADRPGHLRICDGATARQLLVLPGIPGTRCVAFAPDGQSLASGEFSGAIKLRDPATGQERAAWQGHPGGVSGVLFSPDGESLLSTGLDGTGKLWNVKEQQERQTFVGHSEAVVAAAYFRHGQAVVTASRDRAAIVWDVATGQERLRLLGHEDGIEAVAVAPDDKLVATASRDRTVRLWDARTSKELAVLAHKEGPVAALAFSPDGRLLVSAADRTVHFWDVQTQERIASLDKQSRAISTLAFSPRGDYLANGSSLGLLLFAVGIAEDGKPALGTDGWQEYSQSFKGTGAMPLGWGPFGNDAEQCVRFEPEGLRITLPLGQPLDRRGTGVVFPLTIQGDFEITVNFEVLQEPAPKDAGPETRVSLQLLLDNPRGYTFARVSRRVAGYGTHFIAWQVVPADDPPANKKTNWHSCNTKASTGRLRLKRTGALLSYYAAEGLDGPFTLLQQFPFEKENVKEVRLVASPGGPQAAYDVRLSDLRIRAESLPDLPKTPVRVSGSSGKVWAMGTFLGCALLVSVGLWLRRRRHLRAEDKPASVSVQDELAEVEPLPAVTFPCSECGKVLKARAKLAGKKIKCPQCGRGVQVPGPDAGQSGLPA